MKNKIVKNNMTAFDYRARKLGLFGLVLIALTLCIGIPVMQQWSHQNQDMRAQLRTEKTSDTTHVEILDVRHDET